MLGIELNIKGKQIVAALEKGVVSLITTQVSKDGVNSIDLDLKGLNTAEMDNDELIDWCNVTLKDGDEFSVKIRDITENSEPVKIRKHKLVCKKD